MTTEAFDVVTSQLRSVEGVDLVPHPLLIEASAGSGKTWSLSHLTVRFLLEDETGINPDEVLLVTFTRDAARTLRSRVREQLDLVLEFITGLLEGTAGDAHESWQEYYRAQSTETLTTWLQRGRTKMGRLDGLHAHTIHAFAADYVDMRGRAIVDGERQWQQASNEAIAAYAYARPEAFGALMDVADLESLRGVARTIYDAGQRFEGETGEPRSTLLTILPTHTVKDDPDDEMLPIALTQREVAMSIVRRHCELLEQAGAVTFSDLVVMLHDRLMGANGPRFIDQLRANFRVVMIDEFQDTDPLQWAIFEKLFLDAPETRLIMVGDPKQAIYGFRAGSVDTIMAIRELCESREIPISTLHHNHRSSPEMLATVNQFFAGTNFHYSPVEEPAAKGIPFTPAVAFGAKSFTPPNLPSPTGEQASLHLRVQAYVNTAREDLFGELLRYIEHLYANGVTYSDMAFLSRKNWYLAHLKKYLADHGIPVASSTDEDVYRSDAAFQIRLLLVALANPDQASSTEILRASWFRDGTRPGQEPGELVYELAGALAQRGVAVLVQYLTSSSVQLRVLALRDGERHLTDVLHIAEAIARECRFMRAGYLLVDWIDQMMTTKDVDDSAESRRLETESDAVRIMTTHKAKGLEFDTVFFGGALQAFPDFKEGGRVVRRWTTPEGVVVDGGSGIEWGGPQAESERTLLASAWQAGEERRLTYVALTRAKRQMVMWFQVPYQVPFDNEVSRLLYDREPADVGSKVRNRPLADVKKIYVGARRTYGSNVEKPAKENPEGELQKLWSKVPNVAIGTIGTSLHADDFVPPKLLEAPKTPAFVAGVPPLLSLERRRWSYTDIAKTLKAEGFVVEEPTGDEIAGGYDERTVTPQAHESETVAAGVREVFGRLAGARLGAAVHSVLEYVVGSDGETDVAAATRTALREEGFSESDCNENIEVIERAIRALITSPTPSMLGGTPLCDLPANSLAKEMRFLLSLGDDQSSARLVAVARAIVQHDTSGADGRSQFHHYFTTLAERAGGLDEGFLIGSLDLVHRREDGRFVIVDYKTDQLRGDVRPFRPEAMYESMQEEHYPLQAVLYGVALHRHLRATMPDYEPDRHLGGVGYYYVRVAGDPTRVEGDGFATWMMSPAAIVAASDAMELVK